MRCPDGTSRNNERPAGGVRSVQVREYGVEAAFNVATNVLANDPSRPDFSYESIHFRPEMARIGLASLFAGNAEWLAGIASADDVDRSDAVMMQSPLVELSDVVVDWCAGPVPVEHTPAERVDFAEGGRLHSGTVEAEREAADA